MCVATFAVLSYSDNALPNDNVLESVEHGGQEVDVLKNIIHLKAYCLAAWDDARVVTNRFAGKYAAITELVLKYGQEGGGVSRGGRKAKIGNIVMEYAAIIGGLRHKYPRGINKYIVDSIDYAVRHDPNGVTFEKHSMDAFGSGGNGGRKYGHLVAFRKKALGLTNRPSIVVELACKYGDYLHFKTVASAQANNADAVAATMFLKSKGAGHYQSFLQRELAQVARKMRSEFNFVAKAAFGAEHKAFEESYEENRKAFLVHVGVQAPAGREASKVRADTLKWTPPGIDEMKKLAAKHAKKFLAAFQKDHTSTSKIIKNMVDEAGGVKLFVTTSEVSDAQSTMKPTVFFMGEHGNQEGHLRSVPGKGITFVQHFGTGSPIGKLRKMVLTGTGKGLKWSVKDVKVRAGGRDQSVVPMIPKDAKEDTFWLKSGESIELIPDKKSTSKSQYTKQGCFKWVATQECDANGAKDESNNKGCTAEIDSSMSGFCKCDTGAVAKVDCGHATFTCDEMCQL